MMLGGSSAGYMTSSHHHYPYCHQSCGYPRKPAPMLLGRRILVESSRLPLASLKGAPEPLELCQG